MTCHVDNRNNYINLLPLWDVKRNQSCQFIAAKKSTKSLFKIWMSRDAVTGEIVSRIYNNLRQQNKL